MKVELTTKGRFVVTAENDKDNALLFEQINSPKFKSIQLRFVSPKEATDVALGSHKPVVTRKRQNFKECPVEGCGERAKYLALHMRLKHGIWDDKIHDKVHQNAVGREVEVTKPVVQLPNGSYKLRPTAKGLLDV